MSNDVVDLDVRPILRAGGEPFGEIMTAVEALKPGQALRLLATFEPKPLFHVLGSRGFAHEAKPLPGGDWEVVFRPTQKAARANGASAAPVATDSGEWPDAVWHIDARELDPPEPMVNILAATEKMPAGEVLSALLNREPVFLFPELAKRGHGWRGDFEPDGATYRLLVRIGAAREAAA